jgi:hypothetical protein
MASLREIAREYKDEIMSGIAWVAIWKTGRSWNARAFWLNSDAEKIECEEMEEARAIVAADENAIFINEYYTAHMGEGKLDEIMDGIRYMYEEGYNLIKDSAAYDETEDQEEPEGPADTWTAKVISLAEDPEGNQEECTEFIQNRSMKRVYKAALRLCRSQNTAFAAFYKNLSMKEIDTDDARNEETKAEYQLFKGSLGAILLSAKNHRKKLYTIRTNGKSKKGG